MSGAGQDANGDRFETIDLLREGRVIFATIDNPPLHLLTRQLLADLDALTRAVAADEDALVLVIKSRDPDIFLTHNEFANLYAIQPAEVPRSVDEVTLNGMHLICERLRTMDTVTIAQVEGRAAGGGAALVMACDLAFGSLGGAVFNTMSVPLGSVPGGGASQYLPRAIGRSRALELILAGLDLDAATAERWGYLNRALDPDEIDGYVTALAHRIGACSPEAVRHTKALVGDGDGDIEAGLRQENFRFRQLMATDASRGLIDVFLEIGGETRAGELRMGDLLGEVLDRSRVTPPGARSSRE
ncbi:enoyl-CoA hydratase/isomerase family protein [Microbacterium sp. X-17]|uniref:enoyl-CoA hydratase/isomerase family protein n=1 Tax=Microbacterium sp. X-17 TaxID=3144404 RepID=UPI0031F5B2E9